MNKKIDELKKEYENIEVPAEIDFAIEKGIKKGEKKEKYRKRVYRNGSCGSNMHYVSFYI